MSSTIRFSCAILLATVVACACGGSASPVTPSAPTVTPPAAAATTYSGVFGGAALFGGVFQFTSGGSLTASTVSRPMATTSATGTLKPTGQSAIALTGSYDTTTGIFTMSGGGFSITATAAGGAVSGTCKGPDGRDCTIAGLAQSASAAPTSYCGTFDGVSQGVLRITELNGTLTGVAADSSGSTTAKGTVVAGAINMTFVPEPGQLGTVTGTLSGGVMSGNWSSTLHESGTWRATSSGC